MILLAESISDVSINQSVVVDGLIPYILAYLTVLSDWYSVRCMCDSCKGSIFESISHLVRWINNKIPQCGVLDLSWYSWQNGVAICCLCNALKPGCFSAQDLSSSTPSLKRITIAMEIAEFEFGIPQLMDPMRFGIDPASMRCYLSFFKRYEEKRSSKAKKC